MIRHILVLLLALCAGIAGARADARQDCLNLDGDEAIAACDRAIKENSRDAEAYNNRAVAYAGKHDFKRAYADFGKAISLDPKSARFRTDRGRVYMTDYEFRNAIADFTKAIDLDPKYAAPYNERGIVHAEMNNFERAIADFTKAIELSSDYPAGGYLNRGLTWRRKGDAGRRPPDNAFPKDDLLGALGAITDRDLPEYNRALADFNKAIELDANLANAYEARGALKQALGDHADGAADIAKAEAIRSAKAR